MGCGTRRDGGRNLSLKACSNATRRPCLRRLNRERVGGGCVRVCAGMCGYVRVRAGMCAGVCGCVRVRVTGVQHARGERATCRPPA